MKNKQKRYDINFFTYQQTKYHFLIMNNRYFNFDFQRIKQSELKYIKLHFVIETILAVLL